MRTLFLWLLLGTYSSIATAQKNPCEKLDKGVKLYEAKQVKKAIAIWKEIVEKKSNDSSVCFAKAFNNIAYAYLASKDTATAIKWTTKLLAYPVKNDIDWSNIMEPFPNVHYFACARMVSIYQEKRNYETALVYMDSMSIGGKYAYKAFSGTTHEKWAVKRAFWKSEIYQQMGNDKKALFALLQKLLDTDPFYYESYPSYSHLPYHKGVVERILPMVEKQYGKQAFKQSLDDALENMTLSTIKMVDKMGEREVLKATFSLYGEEFFIGKSNAKATKQELIKYFKSTEFYEALK